jgi:hypothetical protein
MTGLHPTRPYFKTFFAGKIFGLGKNNRPRKNFCSPENFWGWPKKRAPVKILGPVGLNRPLKILGWLENNGPPKIFGGWRGEPPR